MNHASAFVANFVFVLFLIRAAHGELSLRMSLMIIAHFLVYCSKPRAMHVCGKALPLPLAKETR